MPASNTRKPERKTPIKIRIHNRQRRLPISKRRLSVQAETAVRLLARQWPADLAEIDVVFISPAASSRVHQEFFGDPAPTDIMTFEHGELLICPAIAEKQRSQSGLSLRDELLTYVIHGLLHLCGWNDLTTKDYNTMSRKQDQLRKKVLSVANP